MIVRASRQAERVYLSLTGYQKARDAPPQAGGRPAGGGAGGQRPPAQHYYYYYYYYYYHNYHPFWGGYSLP